MTANTPVSLKKSGTPSAVPADLIFGELAINYADGKIYFKSANGAISEFASGGGNYFGTINTANSLIVADTSGDVLTLIAGNGVNIISDTINDSITISAQQTFVQNTRPNTAGPWTWWKTNNLGNVVNLIINDGVA